MEIALKESIVTHRGLEPSNPDFFSESTIEAYGSHLMRGYSIEFDPNFTKDGIVVWHDQTLERLTLGSDLRAVRDITTSEALGINMGKGRLGTLEELLELISKYPSSHNTLHLKERHQSQNDVDELIRLLKRFPKAVEKLFIADLRVEIAKYIMAKLPEVGLAASVAHHFDIARFNAAVGNTLLSVDEVLETGNVYDWVWLDEWDLTDVNGGEKKLYTAENFGKLRRAGFKIAVVTPEIHASSPGLLGGESHPDAEPGRLIGRIQEIIALEPDVICTDYPEEVYNLSLKESYSL